MEDALAKGETGGRVETLKTKIQILKNIIKQTKENEKRLKRIGVTGLHQKEGEKVPR